MKHFNWDNESYNRFRWDNVNTDLFHWEGEMEHPWYISGVEVSEINFESGYAILLVVLPNQFIDSWADGDKLEIVLRPKAHVPDIYIPENVIVRMTHCLIESKRMVKPVIVKPEDVMRLDMEIIVRAKIELFQEIDL